MGADFMEVAKNRNFRFLFTGVLVVFVMVGVTTTLDIYMFTYFWELDDSIILPVLIAYAIGNALGTTICVPLFAWWGKKACLIMGGLAWAFFQTLPVVLRLIGWFPENDDTISFAGIETNTILPLLVAVKVIQGFATAQANVGYGSMMADVCDEHEYQTGRRQEGAYFAAVAFSVDASVEPPPEGTLSADGLTVNGSTENGIDLEGVTAELRDLTVSGTDGPGDPGGPGGRAYGCRP